MMTNSQNLDPGYSTPSQKTTLWGNQTDPLNQGTVLSLPYRFYSEYKEPPSIDFITGLTPIEPSFSSCSQVSILSTDICSSVKITNTPNTDRDQFQTQGSCTDTFTTVQSIIHEHLKLHRKHRYEMFSPPQRYRNEGFEGGFSYNERFDLYWASKIFFHETTQLELFQLCAHDKRTNKEVRLDNQPNLSGIDALMAELMMPLFMCNRKHELDLAICQGKCANCQAKIRKSAAYTCSICGYFICLNCRDGL